MIIIAFTVATMGAAFAAPQNGGNPNVTLDVSPNDGQNLTSPQTGNVTGAGFGSNLSGTVFQCGFVSGVKICSTSQVLPTNNGQFFSSHTIVFSSGGTTTLSGTTTTSTSIVTSTSTSTSTSTTNTTMGTTTSTTNTTVPTTTSTTVLSACAKARLAKSAFNAQIDANIAAVNASGLSPADRSAAIARLNAIRAQGNAQLDAQLANCPPAS